MPAVACYCDVSCNNSETSQSSEKIKDTVMVKTTVEKNTQQTEEFTGPAGKISEVQKD